MRKFIFTLLILATFALRAFAEDVTHLEIRSGTLNLVAEIYSHFAEKKVTFADETQKDIPISISAGDALLKKEQAIKLLETILYVKGFELLPQADGSLVLTRYADFTKTPNSPRRFVLPK